MDALSTIHTFTEAEFTRNDLRHTIDPATVGMTNRAGLRYYLDIFTPDAYGSAAFNLLHTSEGRETPPYQNSGSTLYEGCSFVFNRKNGKLDGLLSIEKPAFGSTQPFVALGQTTPFYLRERITGGTPPQTTTNALPPKWAVKGGLSERDYPSYGDTFFGVHQAQARQFLTWQNDEKVVGKNQEEYLSFLLNITPLPTAVQLRVCIEKLDGSEVITTLTTLSSPPFMGVLMFPVGMPVVNPPADCYRYTIWLSDESGLRITELRTYYPDRIRRHQDRSILFSNSLGGWDTLRLVGESTEDIKVSQAFARRTKADTETLYRPELFVVNTDGERSITIHTGWFERNSDAQQAYLEELLLSEDIYLIDKGHRQLKRLTNELVTKQDAHELVGRQFKFTFVETIRNFSALPYKATPARPLCWMPSPNAAFTPELDARGFRTGNATPSLLQLFYCGTTEPVRPFRVRPNVPGIPEYIGPTPNAAFVQGTTPYPNVEITGVGAFTRNNCLPGQNGGPATITVLAATWGGETTGIAQTLAQTEWDSLDTQAYANANGTCTFFLAMEGEAISPLTNRSVIANANASNGYEVGTFGNPSEKEKITVTIPTSGTYTLNLWLRGDATAVGIGINTSTTTDYSIIQPSPGTVPSLRQVSLTLQSGIVDIYISGGMNSGVFNLDKLELL